MTLDDFNTADAAIALAALLRCCASTQWAQKMLALRPFPDLSSMLTQADSIWRALTPADWLEAFAAHPKIGAKKLAGWASQEQSGVDTSQPRLLEKLAQGNRDYEQRFGWIFLINATGKTAPEMIEVLQSRLKNESAGELRVAACEQAKITALRLKKLFEK